MLMTLLLCYVYSFLQNNVFRLFVKCKCVLHSMSALLDVLPYSLDTEQDVKLMYLH